MSHRHFILGNESSDLDSIVSSIIVARYANEMFVKDNEYIAVLVTTKDMFRLKPYCSYVVEEILKQDLGNGVMFVDEFIDQELKQARDVHISLVDGPSVPVSLQLFPCKFTLFNIIDHHQFDPAISYLGDCIVVKSCASNCTNVFLLLQEKVFSDFPSRKCMFLSSHEECKFWENADWYLSLINREWNTKYQPELLSLLCCIVIDSMGMDMNCSDKVTIRDIKATLSIIQFLMRDTFIHIEADEFQDQEYFSFIQKNHSLIYGGLYNHLKKHSSLVSVSAVKRPVLMLQMDHKDYSLTMDSGLFITYGISSIPVSLSEFVMACQDTDGSSDGFWGELVNYFHEKAGKIPKFSFLFVMTCQSNENAIALFGEQSFVGARQLTLVLPQRFANATQSDDFTESYPILDILFPSLKEKLELDLLLFKICDKFLIASFQQKRFKMSRKLVQPLIHESIVVSECF